MFSFSILDSEIIPATAADADEEDDDDEEDGDKEFKEADGPTFDDKDGSWPEFCDKSTWLAGTWAGKSIRAEMLSPETANGCLLAALFLRSVS